jgi:alcohol dehydrogenase
LPSFGSPLEVRTLPDPEPGAGEVVVDVVAAPVLPYHGEVFSGARQYPLLLPLVPGAGAVGRVRAIGPDATRLRAGDWVFCDATVRSRDDAVSPDIMLQGLIAAGEGPMRLQSRYRHGPFADQVLIPMENAVRLGTVETGDAIGWAWLKTMLVPYGGLLASGLEAGETVLITGATGHFGSAGIPVALAMGAARVIAAARNEKMLAGLVERFGSRVRPARIAGDPEADAEVLRAAADGPVDRVLDLVPPQAGAGLARTAALAVRPYGTVVLMGGVREDVALPYARLMNDCVTVRGQFMYPRDAPGRLVQLARAGLLPLDADITTFPLAEANAAVDHAAKNGGPFRMTVIVP